MLARVLTGPDDQVLRDLRHRGAIVFQRAGEDQHVVADDLGPGFLEGSFANVGLGGRGPRTTVPELSHLVVYERRLAAGMSISGVRIAYDDDEVAEVARLAGARPARRPAEAP